MCANTNSERNGRLDLTRAEDGTVSHCAGTWHDITARRQSEDSLREATERIQQQAEELILANADLQVASQAKSDFLAHMSHELRTPLNAALGFARLMQEPSFGPLNEKQQRFVGNIVTSCVHLLQLINDIIDITKIEAGRTDLVPSNWMYGNAWFLVIILRQAWRPTSASTCG